MFGLPLLVDHHEIEKVAERLSKETGSIVTGAQVMYGLDQISCLYCILIIML